MNVDVDLEMCLFSLKRWSLVWIHVYFQDCLFELKFVQNIYKQRG